MTYILRDKADEELPRSLDLSFVNREDAIEELADCSGDYNMMTGQRIHR